MPVKTMNPQIPSIHQFAVPTSSCTKGVHFSNTEGEMPQKD